MRNNIIWFWVFITPTIPLLLIIGIILLFCLRKNIGAYEFRMWIADPNRDVEEAFPDLEIWATKMAPVVLAIATIGWLCILKTIII